MTAIRTTSSSLCKIMFEPSSLDSVPIALGNRYDDDELTELLSQTTFDHESSLDFAAAVVAVIVRSRSCCSTKVAVACKGHEQLCDDSASWQS